MSVGILKPGVAIPTEFRGITYRSRLEANVAQFLLDMGLKFEYEASSYLVGGSHYAPDFYLPDQDSFVEVRGYSTENSESILEEFAKQKGGLIVFYSDRAEQLEYGSEFGLIRLNLTVCICDDGHCSLATLGYPLVCRPRSSPCWYCSKLESENRWKLSHLQVRMRGYSPVLVTELGESRQRADAE